MEIAYIIYFFAGILNNILFTLHIRFIDHDKSLRASAAAFGVSVLSLTVLFSILTQVEGLRGIIWYGFGVAVGTFVAMKLRVRYRGKDLM